MGRYLTGWEKLDVFASLACWSFLALLPHASAIRDWGYRALPFYRLGRLEADI